MWFKYGLGVSALYLCYYPSASDFQFPSAGDRWFRAYGTKLAKLE